MHASSILRIRSTCLRFLWFPKMLKKHVFARLSLSYFFIILGAFGKPLRFCWRPFGTSVVSLACWCHPFGCLWLAWAVFGLSLVLFVTLRHYFGYRLVMVGLAIFLQFASFWMRFPCPRWDRFFGGPEQSSHASKIHVFTNVQCFRLSRTKFCLHWSSIVDKNRAPMQVKRRFWKPNRFPAACFSRFFIILNIYIFGCL